MRKELVNLFNIQSPLLEYARNVTSQFGEDGIIEHIFKVLTPKHKYCVEFGAWDGKVLSNCYNLIKNNGWRGAMIEANTDKFQELKHTYAGHDVAKVNQFVHFDGEGKLDNILASVGAPKDFDILSIDIDGCDYYIWESLTEYAPEVVVVEFNGTIPNDVIFVQEKSFEVNQGSSLLAFIDLGKRKGYELIVATWGNAIFVKKENLHLFNIPNNFIHFMYKSPVDGRIFQGYDSYIHVVGMDRLQFHGSGCPLSSENFQVLPEALRYWIKDGLSNADRVMQRLGM